MLDQTTAQIYCIMEYIKSHQLIPAEVSELIEQLTRYEEELEEGIDNNNQLEDTKEIN